MIREPRSRPGNKPAMTRPAIFVSSFSFGCMVTGLLVPVDVALEDVVVVASAVDEVSELGGTVEVEGTNVLAASV